MQFLIALGAQELLTDYRIVNPTRKEHGELSIWSCAEIGGALSLTKTVAPASSFLGGPRPGGTMATPP